MLKKLLVAIDASEAAASAVRAAEELALQTNCELVLVHVVDGTRYVAPEAAHSYQAVLDEVRRDGSALLSETRTRISSKLDVTALLLDGDPADVIVSTAATRDVDLIVIGTDSRGRLAHFLLGSTADSVIRRAGCPVLTVRREAQRQTSDRLRDQTAPGTGRADQVSRSDPCEV